MAFALSTMQLASTVFKDGGDIPRKYTGEGEDVSPPLSWRDPPAGTSSFALFCHDPDAPLLSTVGTYGFVHWVLYNIPPDARRLEEGTDQYARGDNDFGRRGYGGPLPPPGHGTHHYFFWLLALNLEPVLEDGQDLPGLLEKIEPHVLGMNRLMGTYRRD